MTLTQEQIARIRELEDRAGRITPERVVDDARDKKSPLHPLFEWDKAKAAAAYWTIQARDILRSVYGTNVTSVTTLKVPVYVRDTSVKGEQGYRSVVALRSDPESARESLVYTLEVAAGHLRRAFDLAEPLGLSGEIDALLDQIIGVQRVIKNAA